MSSNCRTGLTTLTQCQHNNVNGSIQRRLSDWRGWRIPPCQRFFLSLIVLLSSLLLPSAAQAAILTVNVLTDEVEDSCPETCSIRAALASANAGDEIQFEVSGTIVLTQGELVLYKDLIIKGPGQESLAIDGNSTSRVLKVNSEVTATIAGLTIQNGYYAAGPEDAVGNWYPWNSGGGGIYNGGTLTLTDSTLSGNSTDNGIFDYNIGEGGGIYNNGKLALTNSTLSGNSAFFAGGGISNLSGTVTLTNSTLSGNSTTYEGGYAGGIYNREGTVTLTNSTLRSNSSSYFGGGIFNDYEGLVTLINSTLSDNSTTWQGSFGGGIYNREKLTLTNSTLSGNSAEYGGGIATESYDGRATVTLTNSTLSGNSASVGPGGGIYYWNGTVTLVKSILDRGTSGENCYGQGQFISEGDNLSNDDTCITTDPTLNDRNNTDPLLDPAGLQDNGGPTLTIALLPESPARDSVLYNDCPPPDTDQRGVPRPAGERCDIGAIEEPSTIAAVLDISPYSDPNTIDLGAQGEITVAILSVTKSNVSDYFNAIDIDPLSIRLGPKGAKATNSPGLVEDVNNDGLADLVLKFSARATGIRCGDDTVRLTGRLTGETFVGIKIEGTDFIQTESCKQITVNVLTDKAEDSCPETCSIRAALDSANAGDEIQFDVSGTIVLPQGELVVERDVTIMGPGAESLALDGNYTSRVPKVNSEVTATLEGLTLQNGFEAGEQGYGGGVFNEGTLTLSGITLSGNHAGWLGGGVYNAGTLTLTQSTLKDNHAEWLGGGIQNEGDLTLTESTLSGNFASSGGGIWNAIDRTANLTNSTFSDNRADPGNGGGVYIDTGGTVTMTNNTFSGSSANHGGGIYSDGTLTMTNNTLSGNSANEGGGIYTGGSGNVWLGSSIVAGSPSGGNCSGYFTSLGNNISSDDTCLPNPSNNDRNNTDPLLDPAGLQDNGGSTLTIALQADSPALDSIVDNSCPPPATDQRGVLRPAGVSCDIGSVEKIVTPVTFSINPGSGQNYVDTSVEGEITIVILSTAAGSSSDYFDALTVDPLSIHFGPSRATVANSTGLIEDINHDGLPDLSLRFNTQDTGILCRDTSVLLTGETFDGNAIQATESIQTQGCIPTVITVNVLTDDLDNRCPTTCSLRAALYAANSGDEIQFGISGTIVLTQGELVVERDVAITGPGAENLALDGNQSSRVMVVNSEVTVSVEGLTIQNGQSGAAGGIYNEGTLKLTNSTLSDNIANDSISGFSGGGIVNTGTLTLVNSTLRDNRSTWATGGGIANIGGTVTLTDSTLSGNISESEGGGGIINDQDGTVTVTNSTLSGNIGNPGGGIWNRWGAVTLTNSTLDNNAAYSGGGIFNEGMLSTLTLTNSTLSGNSANGGSGGGIYNGGTATLINSTISGNSATEFGSNIYNFEGSEYNEEGTVILARSIVANSPSGGNCFGEITSEGDNLSSDATCVANNQALNDRNNTDPLLDPAGLQDNGGPTLTIALQPNSHQAIDGVRHGTCPPPETDQRGVPRPAGVRCDIGAVEMSGEPAPITVALDIKPGSVKNQFNPLSKGKIAVAILSTSPDNTDTYFDATTVDPRSVRFGPKGAKATHRKIKDVNHDGEPDQVLYFKTRATGIQFGDTSAELTGETGDGQAIRGSDTIRTVATVAIDIKPGSHRNLVQPGSTEKIAVAILSTNPDRTARHFDATTVDPRSVRFGPKAAKATHRTVKDINHDGEPDQILYFKTRATGIHCGDTFAKLTGETFNGQAIRGWDTIKTVGPRCLDP